MPLLLAMRSPVGAGDDGGDGRSGVGSPVGAGDDGWPIRSAMTAKEPGRTVEMAGRGRP